MCWSLFLKKRSSGLFKKGPQAFTFLRKRLQHRYFPVKLVGFSRAPFLQNTTFHFAIHQFVERKLTIEAIILNTGRLNLKSNFNIILIIVLK